jgi:transposase
MRPLNRQLTYCDDRIEHLAAQDPRVPRLRSVPSVGPVTAAAFIAAIDDAQRFRHAHQLEAYLGLVPREYSSGQTRRRGAITKAGHSRTRWLLIQAAVSILRRRPPQAEELRTWALRIAARPRQTGGRRRPGPPARRHPLCAAARWQRVRPSARSASSSHGCRPCERVTHATTP